MSDIVFCCQHCKEPLIVGAEGLGMQLPCPRCAKPIEIPYTAIPAHKFQELVFSEQVGDLPSNLEKTLREEYGYTLPGSIPAEPSRALSQSSVHFAEGLVPSRNGLIGVLVMLALISVGFFFALYVQSKTGFTPIEIPPPVPNLPAPSVVLQSGSSVVLGPVSVTLHHAVVAKGLTLGGEAEVGLVLDLSIENTGKEPVYLAYVWSDLQVEDDQGHRLRSSFADEGQPPTAPIELLPGAVHRTPAAFGPVPDKATVFTIRGSPGLWRRKTDGEFTAWSLPQFSLSLSRRDIEKTASSKARDATP